MTSLSYRSRLNRVERDDMNRRMQKSQQMGRVGLQLGFAIDLAHPAQEREARERLHAVLARIVEEGPDSPAILVARCGAWGGFDNLDIVDALYEGIAKEILDKRLSVPT